MNAKEQKPKMGRPATGITPKRYFRMDDESWTLVEQAAKATETTASDFIREAILKAAKRALK